MESGAFAEQLTLVLKALSLSRGRFAADIGVDKSLVGRWCSGSIHPSAHNLARLTRRIDDLHPGFTLHDWDLDIGALAARFGVAAPAGAPVTYGFAMPGLGNGAVAGDGGSDHQGFWRATRPGVAMRDHFIHDIIMVRRAADGTMAMELGLLDIRFRGWVAQRQHQLFVSAMNDLTGTFVFGIFNGLARQRAEVIDGLIMTCLRDATSTPMACKCLLTRVGDLTGHASADEARFAELLQGSPFSAASDVADDVRAHLLHDIGPTAAAAGGDPMLLMHLAQSMTRAPHFNGG